MLFPVISNPGGQGGVTQPMFPGDLSDRLLAFYDQPRRLFTKLKRILPILLGHSDRSFPARNLLVPQSGKWEARHSSDAPWAKKPAQKRSSRTKSGRKPGKQPGASSASRSLLDEPDDRLVIEPGRCRACDASLVGAAEHRRQRRQVVDVCPPPPPTVTEYPRISKVCSCCGAVTTPGWDDQAVPLEHAATVVGPGSPVRIGPEACARAALLACAHYLPVGRARELLETLTAIDVSTGFLAGIRGRAARRLEKTFLDHMKQLLAARRCCMPMRPPVAPPVPCPMCTWLAPATSRSCT